MYHIVSLPTEFNSQGPAFRTPLIVITYMYVLLSAETLHTLSVSLQPGVYNLVLANFTLRDLGYTPAGVRSTQLVKRWKLEFHTV